MPWNIRSVVEERVRFVSLAAQPHGCISELARAFGISRKTAYKWIGRYRKSGLGGCSDESRAPKNSPQAFSPLVVKRLLALKAKWPLWGAKKLVALYGNNYSRAPRPSISSAHAWLKQAGLVRPRGRRPRIPYSPVHRGKLTRARRPNHVWTADFKGDFKLLNGQTCWPLTVTDASTRFLLACVALPSTHAEPVRKIFEQLFKIYGLPEVIRTDNGVPFATDGIYGLTVVSGPWLRYGVIHERTRKAKPQDNGRHERFHRTLKEATCIPPQRDMQAQQRAFDRFRKEYNNVRPHEALGFEPPASKYSPSPRRKPSSAVLAYPSHFHACRANNNGYLQIETAHFFIGRWASKEWLGLEEVRHRCFRLFYGQFPLCEIDLTSRKLTGYGFMANRARRIDFAARHYGTYKTDKNMTG